MPSDLERSLHHISRCLSGRDRRFALVGGLAVAMRANPRLTRDVDVAVATTSDAEAEALVADLRRDGYEVAAVVEHEIGERLATVRLTHPEWPGTLTDLLFASSGIEPEVAASADVLRFATALRVPVARSGHLIAMKVLAREDRSRPLDAEDLQALGEAATEEDWALAAEAVALIAERGFDRGRDLPAALDALRRPG